MTKPPKIAVYLMSDGNFYGYYRNSCYRHESWLKICREMLFMCVLLHFEKFVGNSCDQGHCQTVSSSHELPMSASLVLHKFDKSE